MLGQGITERKSCLHYHSSYTITNLFKTVTFHEKVVKMLKPFTQIQIAILLKSVY